MPNKSNDDNTGANLDLEGLKKRLLEDREQLQRDIDTKDEQIAEGGDDLDPERGGVGNHMADDADEVAEQETMMAIQSSAQRGLDLVNDALARMEAGTYGTCANCGKEINPDRLEARPSSIYCIDCQQLADTGRL